MSDFWMTVLAVFVGKILFNIISVIWDEFYTRYKEKRRKASHTKVRPDDKDISKKRDTYSPDVSGRRAIGFQSRKEEINASID